MSLATPLSDADIQRLQENERRFRKEAESMSRLHALGLRLAETPDLRAALLAVLETAVESQDAQFGLLSLHDQRDGALRVHASIGFDERALARLADLVPGPAAAPCGRAFATTQRVLIADTLTDPLFAPFIDVARAVGFRAVHSTPVLTRAGEVVGVLSVHYARPRLPDDRERALADMCARHAADAIDTAQRRRALMDAERRSRFLVELDDRVRSLADPDDIIDATAEALGQHLSVNRCAYATVEGDQSQFGAECLRRMRAGEPFVISDIHTDPRLTTDERASYAATATRAVMCVPVLTGGRLVAAMAVHASTPRRWEENEIDLVQQVARRCWDSIERAHVVRNLAESERQFRALANSIPNLAWMARPDGWIYWYNDQWYAYTGTAAAEMEGWGWERVHDPRTLAKVKAMWTRSIELGEPFEMVFPLRGADGTFRRFLTRVNPVRNSAGDVTHWFGTNTDVEDERRATESNIVLRGREQLARQEAELQKRLLHSLFMQAPMLIAVLRGPEHVVELANPPVCQIWRHAEEEILNRRLLDVLPELRDQPFPALLDEVFRTGVPHVGSETPARLDRGNGVMETVYFNFVYSPFRNVHGQVEGIFVIASDVTDQVVAREQVNQLREAAEGANRAKDEFLAMLGHELRNPISPILTALQLMKLRGSDGSDRERTVIERQVRHLTRLVDDLLDVSRIARGMVELKTEVVEAAAVVAKAIEMASPLLEQRMHTLTVDCPRTGLAIEGDPTRLSQVICNLVTNAAKYTPPGGHITVRASEEQGDAVLRVRDTGIGIAPDVLPRIFDLFVQEQQAIDRSHGGLGLGLTIARNLIERHGGTISAHSAGRGQGSEFVVRLPKAAYADARAARAQPSRLVATPCSDPLRILVVDDNEDAAEMLAAALEAHGHETRVAHDAAVALRVATELKPGMAFLDIGLPVMDGYELAERLRQLPGLDAIRLIAVTGYGQESDRQKSRAAGFRHHLVKPVDLHVVEEIVCGARDAPQTT